MNFLKSVPTKIYILGFFIIVALGVVFYFLLGTNTKSLVSTRLLTRQQIYAMAEAGNVESFFLDFGNSVVLRARLPRVKYFSEETTQALDEFMDEWGPTGLVGGVIVADDKGIVRYISDLRGSKDVGANISDRDYYKWAKAQTKEGEYFIGTPVISKLGGTKGETIVPVASPIFKGKTFEGIVVAVVELNPLAERFTDVLKFSDTTKIYLANLNGEILHTDSPLTDTGSSIFDLFPELKDSLTSTNEGKFKTRGQLVGYSTISMGNQNWPLLVVSPVQEVASYTVPIYVRLIALYIMLVITILIFGFVTVREVRRQDRTSDSQKSL